jgi:hypothetical protein
MMAPIATNTSSQWIQSIRVSDHREP